MFNSLKIIFVVGLCLTIISCKKNKPNSEPQEFESGMVYCEINEASWSSGIAYAIIGKQKISLFAQSSSSQEEITIDLHQEEIGTFDVGHNSDNFATYLSSPLASSAYISNTLGGSGVVELLDIDQSTKTISGIFDIIGKKTDGALINLNNGVINKVSYITTDEIEITYINYFKAKINGVPYEPTVIYSEMKSDLLQINTAENNSFPNLILTMKNNITVGNYPIHSFGNYTCLYKTANNKNEFYQAESGEISIQSHDTDLKIIEGVFNAVLEPVSGSSSTKTFGVSAGHFIIEY